MNEKSLATRDLSIAYGEKVIVDDLNIEIPKGKITTIIGPNGCGKSTTLKSISRILKPKNGSIYISGKEIDQFSTREIAKQMAILPQTPNAPERVTVEELVSYGRFPHKKGFGRLKEEDKSIITWALKDTNMNDYNDMPIGNLSGGQRQRVWIAMALAQQTELILLDEPTTYLDLAHQLEILTLLQHLNESEKRTIVMVLHDLNLASRFSDYIISMKNGKVISSGTPKQVMTKKYLAEVFNIDAAIEIDPRNDKPICIMYDLIV
jgi:iron complex transport system ATP-binding protein